MTPQRTNIHNFTLYTKCVNTVRPPSALIMKHCINRWHKISQSSKFILFEPFYIYQEMQKRKNLLNKLTNFVTNFTASHFYTGSDQRSGAAAANGRCLKGDTVR